MNEYSSLLLDLGLSEKESALYLALLELGQADVTEIAAKAGVKRSTAYVVLDELVGKGFAAALPGVVRRFSAEEPQKLLAFEKHKVASLEKALPGLLGLACRGQHKPGVRFLTGLEGIRVVYEDSLLVPPGSEILSISNAGSVYATLPEFTTGYVQRRVERGISLRGITPSTPESIAVSKKDAEELRRIRFLQPDQLSQEVEVNIYGDKISAVSFAENELIAMILDSAVFTAAHRQLFEILWNVARDPIQA